MGPFWCLSIALLLAAPQLSHSSADPCSLNGHKCVAKAKCQIAHGQNPSWKCVCTSGSGNGIKSQFGGTGCGGATCPASMLKYFRTNTCYGKELGTGTFDQLQARCAAKFPGSKLAALFDDGADEFIGLQLNIPSGLYWIGYKYEDLPGYFTASDYRATQPIVPLGQNTNSGKCVALKFSNNVAKIVVRDCNNQVHIHGGICSQPVASQACGAGWKEINGACWSKVVGTYSYLEQALYCSEMGGDLAIFSSKTEQASVISGLSFAQHDKYYIGYTKGYVTTPANAVKDIEGKNVAYHVHYQTTRASPACIGVVPQNGKWAQVDCSARLPAICRKHNSALENCPQGAVKLGARCYQVRKEKKSYASASLSCMKIGGDLVSVTSQGINDLVKTLMQLNGVSGNGWIGLREGNTAGHYSWADGSAYLYQNFMAPGPDDGQAGSCGFIKPSGKWGPAAPPCSERYTPICEYVNTPCRGNSECLAGRGQCSNGQCRCRKGYSGDGLKTCKDINECLSNPCDSSAVKCENTVGSFKCVCPPGQTGLGTKASPCVDTSKCRSNSDCHARATCKSNGVCVCNSGYRGDGKHCKNINECLEKNNCHANAFCRDRPGSYRCICKHGYTGNGFSCTPLPKHCHDIYLKNPHSINGEFVIDPDFDGPLKQLTVKCRFEGQGITIFDHNFLRRFRIPNNTGPKSLIKNILYANGANTEQITAVLDLMGFAKQNIQFTAQGPVAYIGNNAWVDRNGKEVASLAGPIQGATGPSCPCGPYGLCEDASQVCSCNAKVPVGEFRSDRGVIIDKNLLPIRKLNLGGTSNFLKRAWIRLGALECAPKQFGIPKDCQDGKINHNVLYNGMELIDVDGPSGPLAPFYVYCNVKDWTNTAITEVASSSIGINGQSGQNSVDYKQDFNALKQLASNSGFCIQEVDYQCINSPIAGSGSPVTTWVSVAGTSMSYWAGVNALDDNICPCGVVGFCDQGSSKCNCNNYDGKHHRDFGTIIDKDKLPVSGINIGKKGHKARYTIGRLRCGAEQFGIFASCQELRQSGVVKDGPYWIDPDGAAANGQTNTAPFLVQCEFDTQKMIGITIVPASRYTFTDVGESVVNYNTASKEQLTDLIGRSAYCTQEITYNCKNSRLFDGHSPLASWTGKRDHVERTYYHGDGSVKKCKCGIEKNCQKYQPRCNCDAGDYTKRKDSGLLMNKAHLPIGKVKIGDKPGGSQAKFQIGPLKCYELFATCEDLAKNYKFSRGRRRRLSAGRYIIDPDAARSGTSGFEVICHFPFTLVIPKAGTNQGSVSGGSKQCFDIKYSASAKELKLLTEASTVCQQYVKYVAKKVSFTSSVHWKDNNGLHGKGWGGSKGAAECACGTMNRCSGGSKDACNTDNTSSGKFERDAGYLIDKKILPVQDICINAKSSASGSAVYSVAHMQCGPSYVGIYADCQELRLRSSISKSGAYLIDPDRQGPLEPFTAYCEMTQDPPAGVTVIPTEREDCQEIDDEGGDVQVTYIGASLAQIKALKKTSVYAEQFISYQCKGAKLTFKENAGWFSIENKKIAYWGGNTGGTGCKGGACKCKGHGVNAKDEGKLLDFKTLPVTKFVFNSVEAGTRCIKVGAIKFFDIEKDCDAIFTKGKFRPGVVRYAIDPDAAGGVGFFGATCSVFKGINLRSIGVTTIPLENDVDVTTQKKVTLQYKGASIQQVRTLVEKSKWCKQGISYTCKNAAVIKSETNLVTLFKTYNGAKSDVWAGADHRYNVPNVAGCACGLLNSCPGGNSEICKCNVFDGKTRKEGGLVTNRDILPISSVVRGAGESGVLDYEDIACGPSVFGLPRDCEGWKARGAPSGEYLIWPDRRVQPFIVYCNMDINPRRGVTVLKPSKTVINIGPGDTKVTYLEASEQQAYRLMTASNRCYMPIRLDCNNFPLFDKSGNPTLLWFEQNSRSVTNNRYWGDARGNSAKECSCGNDNECAGDDGRNAMRNRRCNCDIGDNKDRVDAGIWRIRGDMPCVGFRNLGISKGSLKITLGNLYCADGEFDLDVCNTKFHDCDKNAKCKKINWNKYDCECNKGWQGRNRPGKWANGRVCFDDDECADNPCNNKVTATCVNTPGSYKCECKKGFTLKPGDKNTCIDVNECTAGTHNCHAKATCINTYGGFTCSCNRGYAGNGKQCEPIGECTCWGDPHCMIYDDRIFHFYGPCSYTMTRDNCANGKPAGKPTFQVDQINWRQGRTNTRGSWIQAVKISVYHSTIILDQKKVVSVNGVTIPGFSSRPLTSLGHPDLLIVKAGPYVRVTADVGFEVRWDGDTKVDVVVKAAFQGKMCGMCGNFNNNPADDFVTGPACAPKTAAGSMVTNTNTFAASWMTGDSRDYKTSQCTEYCTLPPEDLCKTEGDRAGAKSTCAQIYDENFAFWPCLKVMDPKIRAAYESSCKFDLCAGVKKCAHADSLAKICAEIYQVPIVSWRSPSFCGAPNCGKNMEYKVCGSLCQPTCVYPKGVPNCNSFCIMGCFCKDGFVLEGENCVRPKDCGCTHKPTGTYVSEGTTVLVSCTEECTCTKGNLQCKPHTCPPSSSCIVRFGVRGCYCNKGFRQLPDKSCQDIDECKDPKLNNCNEKADCKNLVPGFKCTCKEGYFGDGVKKCDDVDECLKGTHKCDVVSTTCKDTDGSFKCLCKPGYTRETEFKCKNVDECSGPNQCDAASTICVDTQGSYNCKCKKGYVRVDRFTCKDDDECADPRKNNCDRNANCRNTDGGFTCTCKKGYVGDGKTCKDFDECKNNAFTCGSNEKCVNTIGSYKCVCVKGYTRNAQNVCDDIDECSKNTDNCVESKDGGVCKDIDGSFECSCKEGYEGDGKKIANGGKGCKDIDECLKKPCGVNQNCKNTIGSFICSCKTGFRRNANGACVNIDECKENKDNCVENVNGGRCIDTIGSFRCKCRQGYTGDGVKGGRGCTDINECSRRPGPCGSNEKCTNNKGSFKCTCIKGYRRNSNKVCVDIDECKKPNPCVKPNKGGMCVNTPGSFTCKCLKGYSGDGFTTGTGCSDVDECAKGTATCGDNEVCKDKDGGFDCVCRKGYRRNPQTGKCIDINECRDPRLNNCVRKNQGGKCRNLPGSFECSCERGYTGNGVKASAGGNGCNNIVECDDPRACGANEVCTDTVGSFKCTCKKGYRRGPNKVCIDINECTTGANDCVKPSDGGMCVNTPGSFTCKCITGYAGDGRKSGRGCTNINECDNPNACGVNEDCKDNAGSFVCTCKKGYRRGPNKVCVDIDECTEGGNDCVKPNNGGMCVNTPGSFRCKCVKGYFGDGKTTGKGCSNVDECKDPKVCGENEKCVDSTGSFKCVCQNGYKRGPNNKCVDIDECQTGANDCVAPNDGGMCTNTPGSYTCKCVAGYTGNGRKSGTGCTNVNECTNPNICKVNEKCVDEPGKFKCVCAKGYRRDPVTKLCKNINECAENLDDCVETADGGICMDTDGSFKCSCSEGYQGDGKKGGQGCKDVNECKRVGPPICGDFSKCTNKVPGFSCECLKGYESPTNNGKNCKLIPTCTNQNIKCIKGTCMNGKNGPKCVCNTGYKKLNKYTCVDIDECKLNTDNCNKPNMICINTPGGYKCSCKKGYYYSAADHECKNVNECDKKTFDCPKNSFCVDTVGGFTCKCNKGYREKITASGRKICVNIDECRRRPPVCDRNARCKDTPGSFTCTCNKGYSGNGFKCDDVDECAEKKDNCPPNSFCKNTPGGFTCICKKGYKEVIVNGRKRCRDINECNKRPPVCDSNATCKNNPGSFTCTCNKGYSGNGFKCDNVDECDNPKACPKNSRCVDAKGSFKCICLKGYKEVIRPNGRKVCMNINECENPNVCDKNASCQDKPGTFVCKCNKGYRGNGFKCDDIDECQEKKDNCQPNSFCKNTPGGFLCICKTGYREIVTASGKKRCVNIDECKKRPPVCDSNATCKDTPGSFTCTCNKGYTGNGFKCDNVNECDDPTVCPKNSRCMDANGSFKCICLKGFKEVIKNGKKECENINECDTPNRCDKNAICQDTIGSFKCVCKKGYTGNGFQCEDVDECTAGTFTCQPNSKCKNTIGSFICVCDKGYIEIALGNKKVCQDIDECADPSKNNCDKNADCTNTPGSFTCKCKKGYVGNGITCTDDDECATGKHNCPPNSRCVDKDGSFDCICNEGYKRILLANLKYRCDNIDECKDPKLNTCSKNAVCTDTPGSFKCTCKEGYIGNGKICNDLNECLTGKNNCPKNSKCQNTIGSFLCNCVKGYKMAIIGGKMVCEDIDECKVGPTNCNTNAVCINTPGSFKCVCKPGFTGNGIICNDIPDCDNNPCAVHATCTELPGGFKCTCLPGYTGDGKTCVNIDECKLGTAKCAKNAECVDTIGGYYCRCKKGYEGHCDDCWDIDECHTGLHDCATFANCRNTPGSFRCECKKGYIYKDKSCQDVNECLLGIDNCDDNTQNCINTRGSFKCECKRGYYQKKDGTCADIDECRTGTSNCNRNAVCTNTPGSFTCVCRPGYAGDGKICILTDPTICGKLKCNENAVCIRKSRDPLDTICVCKAGYTGLGVDTAKGPGCVKINSCAVTNPCESAATCVDTPAGQQCVCPAGYRAVGYVCISVDPCKSPRACGPDSTCITISNTKFKCKCNPGYVYDAALKICKDVDECAINAFKCPPNAKCVNSIGSYKCVCKTGYRRTKDDNTCRDIDECLEGLDNCDDKSRATCTNTAGSFTCQCKDNYYGNGRKCLEQEVPDCDGPCGAFAFCAVTSSGAKCKCRSGYEAVSTNPLVCKDIDECLSKPCSKYTKSVCVNFVGSFKCVCPTGYAGVPCEDIDECEDPRSCSPFATCQNLPGAFKCTCKKGFKGNGKECTTCEPKDDPCNCGIHGHCNPKTLKCKCKFGFAPNYKLKKNVCQDIDDCSKPGRCHPKAICTNVVGGYRCQCPSGWKGDGKFCTRDQCQSDSDCHKHGACKYITSGCGCKQCVCKLGYVGDGVTCTPVTTPCAITKCPKNAYCQSDSCGAVCECLPGYQGNGESCVDINECVEYPPRCHRSAVCKNTPGTYKCVCPPGFKKSGTITGACHDINECVVANDCHSKADCKNTYGSYICSCRDGYVGNGKICNPDISCGGGCPKYATCTRNGLAGYSCVCRDGFILKGTKCVEINECKLGIDNCRSFETCRDTFGSFTCDCRKGYTKVGKRCVDINECTKKGICGPAPAGCINTLGSFRCFCPPGWVYSIPRRMCVPNNICSTPSNPCSQQARCTQSGNGTFTCVCNSGYVGNGLSCIPNDPKSINLCIKRPGICGNGRCKYTPKGHICICPPGFFFDGRTCSNINECALPPGAAGAAECENAVCVDRVPGYECLCKPGYRRKKRPRKSRFICEDINECTLFRGICNPFGVCTNTPGSYLCQCPAGFANNGRRCADVNECLNKNICGNPAYSTCVNTVGSYKCLCKTGFKFNGRVCVDINECTANSKFPCNSAAECVNNVGSFVCVCKKGYEYKNNKCVDINECAIGRDPCGYGADCRNTPGSFKCVCRPGYVHSGRKCEPICDFGTCRRYEHCRVVYGQPKCSCKCYGKFCVEDGPICATDGLTYSSFKEFLECRCKQQLIGVRKDYDGNCQTTCDKLKCPEGKGCEVIKGIARCTCHVDECTLAALSDTICTNFNNQYPRCLFYILRCLGQLLKGEKIAHSGPCIRGTCRYGPWSSWSGCSAQCGYGTRTRSRPVIPGPLRPGLVCKPLTESKGCIRPPCPGDACQNHVCPKPEALCYDRSGKPICECPTCDTASIKKVCGMINGKMKTFQNLCHLKREACTVNAKDHTFLHLGPCNTAQNLPLECTMLPYYTKVRSANGKSRDIVQVNRCFGGCGNRVGKCCVPTGVSVEKVLIRGVGKHYRTKYAKITKCECIPRSKRPHYVKKLLGIFLNNKKYIIPRVFSELRGPRPVH